MKYIFWILCVSFISSSSYSLSVKEKENIWKLTRSAPDERKLYDAYISARKVLESHPSNPVAAFQEAEALLIMDRAVKSGSSFQRNLMRPSQVKIDLDNAIAKHSDDLDLQLLRVYVLYNFIDCLPLREEKVESLWTERIVDSAGQAHDVSVERISGQPENEAQARLYINSLFKRHSSNVDVRMCFAQLEPNTEKRLLILKNTALRDIARFNRAKFFVLIYDCYLKLQNDSMSRDTLAQLKRECSLNPNLYNRLILRKVI